jgi:hypothetical protein
MQIPPMPLTSSAALQGMTAVRQENPFSQVRDVSLEKKSECSRDHQERMNQMLLAKCNDLM